MSSLILCKSRGAKTPYVFNVTDTKIYTIEELCYYIYNNIYILTEKVFDEKLILSEEEQEMKQAKAKKNP